MYETRHCMDKPQILPSGAGDAITIIMARKSGLQCTSGHAVDTHAFMLSRSQQTVVTLRAVSVRLT